jgi:hypothetical protein
MNDLASRLSNRVQLTTDGHRAYFDAVDGAFASDIDYAMLVKLYGGDPANKPGTRYSPAQCVGAGRDAVIRNPNSEHVSASFVERQNLSMRTGMRRFTPPTNDFSKKLENHMYALSIYFMHYNFVRIHQTVRVPPAMAAGVADTLWSNEDLVRIVGKWEADQKVAKSN